MTRLLLFIFSIPLLSCGEPPKKTIYVFEDIDSIAWGVMPAYAYMGGLREKSNNQVLNDDNLDTNHLSYFKQNFIQQKTFTGNKAQRITECFRFHLAEGTDEVEHDQEKRLPPEYRDVFIFYRKNTIAGWAKISFSTEEIGFKSYRDYESEMGGYAYTPGVDYISLKQILQ